MDTHWLALVLFLAAIVLMAVLVPLSVFLEYRKPKRESIHDYARRKWGH